MKKGRLIYEDTSHTPPLMVYENRTLRWLSFDNNYIQTIIHKRQPWRPELCYLKALCDVAVLPVTRVLVLGLGGGAIIHYLKHQYPHADIEAVEINPTIIKIARRYFAINVPVTCDCALNYLDRSNHYSHIYIDVFTKHIESEHSFIEHLLEKTQGAKQVSLNLIFNELSDGYALINCFRKQFNQQTLCVLTPGKNNIVLHGFLSGNYLENLTRLHQDNIIKKPMWDQALGAVSELNRQ